MAEFYQRLDLLHICNWGGEMFSLLSHGPWHTFMLQLSLKATMTMGGTDRQSEGGMRSGNRRGTGEGSILWIWPYILNPFAVKHSSPFRPTATPLPLLFPSSSHALKLSQSRATLLIAHWSGEHNRSEHFNHVRHLCLICTLHTNNMGCSLIQGWAAVTLTSHENQRWSYFIIAQTADQEEAKTQEQCMPLRAA